MAVQLVPAEIAECETSLVEEGEEAVEVSTRISLSVEYLEVIPPPDRAGRLCTIYGEIFIWDMDKGFAPHVTLLDCSRDEAETIDLDPEFRFLTLYDDESARPLWGGSPLFVKMKLWEIVAQDDATKDRIIADIDFEFHDFYPINKRDFLEIEGKSGFQFCLAYANVYAAVSLEVQFTINKNIVAPGNSNQLIYGTIAAIQGIDFEDCPAVKLFFATSHHPRQVEMGTPIDLHRKLVVAPTGGGTLGISYALIDASTDQLFAHDTLPFRILRGENCIIRAPKSLKYTKQAGDGLISISVTMVPYKLYR